MRKLRKSDVGAPPLGHPESWIIAYRDNTSIKPYLRLMHSLASLIYGQEPSFPKLSLHNDGPNRAARRKSRFGPCQLINNRRTRRACVFNSPEKQAVVDAQTPPERKLTGAVRRGLERGRTA